MSIKAILTYIIAISFLYKIHLILPAIVTGKFCVFTNRCKSYWFSVNHHTDRIATALHNKLLDKLWGNIKCLPRGHPY